MCRTVRLSARGDKKHRSVIPQNESGNTKSFPREIFTMKKHHSLAITTKGVLIKIEKK
jgi:hypothetical protein